MLREENLNITLLNRVTNSVHLTQRITGFTEVEILTKKQMANHIIRGPQTTKTIESNSKIHTLRVTNSQYSIGFPLKTTTLSLIKTVKRNPEIRSREIKTKWVHHNNAQKASRKDLRSTLLGS